MVALILAFIASVGIGIGLGATPGLNTFLHINWLWIIPVGGLIIGALLGFVQFGIYRVTDTKPGTSSVWLLCLLAMAGLFSTYIGIWAFTTISGDASGILIREMVSFREFMELTLSQSSYEGRGDSTTTFGQTGTTLLFIGDLLGAALGSYFVWNWALKSNPFCEQCGKWMKKDETLEYSVAGEEDAFAAAVEELQAADNNGGYRAMIEHFRKRDAESKVKKEGFVFHGRHFHCPSCRGALLVGGIDVWNDKGKRARVDGSEFATAADQGGHYGRSMS